MIASSSHLHESTLRTISIGVTGCNRRFFLPVDDPRTMEKCVVHCAGLIRPACPDCDSLRARSSVPTRATRQHQRGHEFANSRFDRRIQCCSPPPVVCQIPSQLPIRSPSYLPIDVVHTFHQLCVPQTRHAPSVLSFNVFTEISSMPARLTTSTLHGVREFLS